jgi:hypothetical protein
MLPQLPETPQPPQTPLIGKGKAGPGRPKGLANRTTALLKDAILKAAEQAGGGGKGGLEAFLVMQAAKENNAPFMALLGKVLPMHLSGGDGSALEVTFRTVYDAAIYDETARAADVLELAALRALPGPPLT